MPSSVEQFVIDFVKKTRLERHISMEQIAFAINTSKEFVQQVENPRKPHKYNLNHIICIAEFLKISPREFLPETTEGLLF